MQPPPQSGVWEHFEQFKSSLLPYWVCFIFLNFIYLATHLVLVAAGEILVPRPGIEPGPRALGVQGLSHWTTRKRPCLIPLYSLSPLPPGLGNHWSVSSLSSFASSRNFSKMESYKM